METFLSTCAAQNPNRRLRLIALADRVSMRVERADFDDLVTLVSQAPPWEKDRAAGVRILLRAIAEAKPDAPDQILARWTWRLSRAVRKQLDRKASQEYPDAKRLLGALANSRGHRHEENAAKLVNAALEMPREVGAALLASAEGYTPRASQLLEAARERLGSINEVAGWIAENLPQPKTGPSRTRRRRRRKKKTPETAVATPETTAAAEAAPAENSTAEAPAEAEQAPAPKKRRRRKKKADESVAPELPAEDAA
jgi:ribonuclease E